MPGNPHECREHAKNCLRLAEETRLPEAKANFEALAQRLMAIAADLGIHHRATEGCGRQAPGVCGIASPSTRAVLQAK